MDYNPSLETRRLILRKISEADKMDLFELLTNSQIDKKMVWNHLDDMNEITEYLNEIIGSYHNDQPSCFGIELKESGKLIGIIIPDISNIFCTSCESIPCKSLNTKIILCFSGRLSAILRIRIDNSLLS